LKYENINLFSDYRFWAVSDEIRNLNIFDELKRHLLSKETAFYTVL